MTSSKNSSNISSAAASLLLQSSCTGSQPTALHELLRLHCGAKGERNTVVDVSVGGSLLRGACDRSLYAVHLAREAVGS